MDYNQDKCEELEQQTHYDANYTVLGEKKDPTIITKKCVVCEEEFTTSDPNQITCDRVCNRHYYSAFDEYEEAE
jgi:hypothetical protein